MVPLTHTRNMDYTHVLDHNDRESSGTAVASTLACRVGGRGFFGTMEMDLMNSLCIQVDTAKLDTRKWSWDINVTTMI